MNLRRFRRVLGMGVGWSLAVLRLGSRFLWEEVFVRGEIVRAFTHVPARAPFLQDFCDAVRAFTHVPARAPFLQDFCDATFSGFHVLMWTTNVDILTTPFYQCKKQ